ncbi:MAG: lysophospholipid acyltransferase family protein, partial [Flavobacteriales bacterium]|nr:lysophospholipid acyltransferase family protein [Flavobacteriales bacterium]
ELRKVERQFYQHFCDIIVESLKNFTVSRKRVAKRMVIENPEIMDQFHEQGRNVIVVGGHYNAWELYALAMPIYHKHVGVGVYKPLSNKFFDNKLRTSREKYGLELIPMKESAQYFANENNKGKYAFILGSDQSPSNPSNAYWMDFMSQDTPVLFGAEKNAKQYNLPIVFGHATKVRRGYYTLKYTLLFDNSAETSYGEITKSHTQFLEKIILQKPQFWLWSHRRWKHKRPEKIRQDEQP